MQRYNKKKRLSRVKIKYFHFLGTFVSLLGLSEEKVPFLDINFDISNICSNFAGRIYVVA